MKPRKVALIIFYDSKHRVLIQDRRVISKLGEEWGYFGGEIEPGETAEQAVRREAKEELSYDLKEVEHLMDYDYFAQAWDRKVEAQVFIAKAPPLSELQQKEGKAMRVFTLEEASKLKMVCKEDWLPLKALERRFNMIEQKVQFKNSKGKTIVGVLFTPANYKFTVVFVNGIGIIVKTRKYIRDCAEFLCSNGFRVLMFDYYGRGDSDGEWEEMNMTTALDSLKSAVDFLKTDSVGLIGESFGGGVSLNLAAKDKRVKAIALLYASYNILEWHNGQRYAEAKKLGFTFSQTYPDKKYPLSLFEDALKYVTLESIKKTKAPILITHGDADTSVPLVQAKEIYEAANEPKKLVILKGEEHVYSEEGFKKAFNEILVWFKRYLK